MAESRLGWGMQGGKRDTVATRGKVREQRYQKARRDKADVKIECERTVCKMRFKNVNDR